MNNNYYYVLFFFTLAQISIRVASAVALSSTSVNVTWIPLNEPVVDLSYIVYYARVNISKSRQRGPETATFPANASSGVVSGLQEGQQYNFSVSVTLIINGQTYNSTPGEPLTVMTGIICIHLCVIVDLCSVKIRHNYYCMVYYVVNTNMCLITL